jgi:hypothetical protein
MLSWSTLQLPENLDQLYAVREYRCLVPEKLSESNIQTMIPLGERPLHSGVLSEVVRLGVMHHDKIDVAEPIDASRTVGRFAVYQSDAPFGVKACVAAGNLHVLDAMPGPLKRSDSLYPGAVRVDGQYGLIHRPGHPVNQRRGIGPASDFEHTTEAIANGGGEHRDMRKQATYAAVF